MGRVLKYVFTNNELHIAEIEKNGELRPYEKILVIELSEDMTTLDASKRPTAKSILEHPIWWHEEKISIFFHNLSDRVEANATKTDLLNMLKMEEQIITGGNWKNKLDNKLVTEWKKKYTENQQLEVRYLLRAIRNTVSCQVLLNQ